jgi:pilus assembly protein CpaB
MSRVDLRERALPLAALLCSLVGLVFALGGADEPARAQVLVAVRSVAAGSRIPADALRLVPIDARDRTPSMLGTASAAAGRVVVAPLRPGDYVQRGGLEDGAALPALGPGQRAFTLRLEPSAAPPAASLVPGTTVDVIVSTDADGRRGAGSSVAASGLEILTPVRHDEGALLVTLRTTVRQAVALTAAQSFAHDLRLLGRPGGDG